MSYTVLFRFLAMAPYTTIILNLTSKAAKFPTNNVQKLQTANTKLSSVSLIKQESLKKVIKYNRTFKFFCFFP